MGGDLGPHAVFSACEKALLDFPFLEISAFGTAQATECIPLSLQENARFDWQQAHETFSAELKPTDILRHKQSSLWLAVEHLALEKADACVSGGSTGALMVAGKRLLGMVPGIDRPAICQRWPTRKGQTYMLDLGANLDVSPELLLQFAQMGSVLSEVAKPKVALLNIGTESNKGGSLLAQAAALIGQDEALLFAGFIEANHLLDGDVDIVVTDGFTGNVALKASEGAAMFLIEQLKAAFMGSWYGKLVGQLAKPVLLKWRTQFDPGRYNGASFLGLSRPLIKSHGSADAQAFYNAIRVAVAQTEHKLPALLAARFKDFAE